MRSTFADRALALLLSLTFLAGVGGEAYGSHADARGGPGAGHDGVAGPSTAPDQDASTGDSGPAPERSPCTCIGTCHGAAAAPVPAEPEPDLGLLRVLPEMDPAPVSRPFLPRLTPYLLPYANAPPPERSSARA